MTEIAPETLEKPKACGQDTLTAQLFRRGFRRKFRGGGTSKIRDILATGASPARGTELVKRLHGYGNAECGCHRTPPDVPGRV